MNFFLYLLIFPFNFCNIKNEFLKFFCFLYALYTMSILPTTSPFSYICVSSAEVILNTE